MKPLMQMLIACAAILAINSNINGQSVDVYPNNSSYWTGSVRYYSITPGKIDSDIRAGDANVSGRLVGWAKFNISSIPNNATITSVVFHGYVFNTGCSSHELHITALDIDPVSSSATDLVNELTWNPGPAWYVDNNVTSMRTTGWKTITLNDEAEYALENALSQNWFAIAFQEHGVHYNNGTCNRGEFYGYNNSTYKPYLTVNYTIPCGVPSLNDCSAISTTSLTLDWLDATGATSYNIRYRESGSSWNNTTSTSSSKTINGLNPGTGYEWQVQSDCSGFTSNWSSSGYCTTDPIIIPCVAVSITNTLLDQTKTVGQTATWSVSTSGDAPFSYQWYKNYLPIPGATSYSYTTPTLTLSDDGNTYYCEVTNCSGSEIDACNTAYLYVIDGCTVVSITNTLSNQTKTVGQTATWSVSTSGDAPFTYKWYKNGLPISGATNYSLTTPSLTLNDNGNTYYCEVTNCSGSSSDVSNTAVLTVNENPCVPIADFSYTRNGRYVEFSGSSNCSNVTWAWDFGDGKTDSIQYPTNTYAEDGVFYVSLTVSNTKGSDTKTEGITVGIEEIDFIQSLTLYPNPTTGIFTVEMELTQPEPITIQLLTITGQKLLEQQLVNSVGTYRQNFDLSHAKGVYMLQVLGKEGVMGRKIIVY